MSAADARELFEAEAWQILGEYSPAPRVHHVDRLLTLADAYAREVASEAKAKPKAAPAERKPPAVHYSPGGYRHPACLMPYERHGSGWQMTPTLADVTCGHCLKKLPATAATAGRPS